MTLDLSKKVYLALRQGVQGLMRLSSSAYITLVCYSYLPNLAVWERRCKIESDLKEVTVSLILDR
jgi:hypothetical protein